MTFRYGIFASVSTDEQAHDKDSLNNQVTESRIYAERLGGIETAGPFIADGYSRTGYYDLSDAMNNIPALKGAIQSAEHNEYDVLFVRYFDRLGDVGHNVFIKFKQLKKQLRSVQESTPITPPELYDPYKDTATATLVHIGGIYQDTRINRIVNNQRENMPKRIRDGLAPGRTPYGYIYTGKRTPPKLDPEKSKRLLKAKDMLLNGASLHELACFLGVTRRSVRRIFSNPFYCGQVTFGKTFSTRNGVRKIVLPASRTKWVTGEGKHEPLWTESEHDRIQSELRRRIRGDNSPFLFNKLLVCDVCGGRARRHYFGSTADKRLVITCRKHYSKHICLEYDDFFQMAAKAIQDALEQEQLGETEDNTTQIRQHIKTRQALRRSIQEGYEAGVYNASEAAKMVRDVEDELLSLEKQLQKAEEEQAASLQASSAMEDIDFQYVPEWLEQSDPGTINRLLGIWLKEIRVKPDGIIIIRR